MSVVELETKVYIIFKYILFSRCIHVNAGCIIQVANTLITVCGAKVGRGEGRISNACQQQRRLSQILNVFIPTSRSLKPLEVAQCFVNLVCVLCWVVLYVPLLLVFQFHIFD